MRVSVSLSASPSVLLCRDGRGRGLTAGPARFLAHAAKKELLEPPDFNSPATPTPGAARTVRQTDRLTRHGKRDGVTEEGRGRGRAAAAEEDQ